MQAGRRDVCRLIAGLGHAKWSKWSIGCDTLLEVVRNECVYGLLCACCSLAATLAPFRHLSSPPTPTPACSPAQKVQDFVNGMGSQMDYTVVMDTAGAAQRECGLRLVGAVLVVPPPPARRTCIPANWWRPCLTVLPVYI